MTFSENDEKFMKIALEEAKTALDTDDYPVGAVLVIEGKMVEKTRNSLRSKNDWVSHAESNLINKCSPIIKQHRKLKNENVELFTTLEPCLMCFGASVLHRISRIVFACPDPHGGATIIKKDGLSQFYQHKWPVIDGGLFKEESYELLVEYMKKHINNWSDVLPLYEKMRKEWQ